MGYWKKDQLYSNGLGDRYLADIYIGGPNEGGEVITRHKLAPGEVWPPPKVEPPPNPEVARRERERAALLSGIADWVKRGRE